VLDMNKITLHFNDFLAIIVILVLLGYIYITSWLNWDNKIVDLSVGVFLAKFSDIVQYYFRRAPPTDKGDKSGS